MAQVVAKGLREHSYAVDVRRCHRRFYQTSINDYDLILLDVLLPGPDGFEVCRELRARGDATPVLILTARATIDDSHYRARCRRRRLSDKALCVPRAAGPGEGFAEARAAASSRSVQIEDLLLDAASHRVSRAAVEMNSPRKNMLCSNTWHDAPGNWFRGPRSPPMSGRIV